jgi:hypothetical protein
VPWVFFRLCDSSVFSPVRHFIGQISEYGVPVQAKQVFMRIPDMGDNILCSFVTLINLARWRKISGILRIFYRLHAVSLSIEFLNLEILSQVSLETKNV